MAKVRRWTVWPDPETGIVDRGEIVQAFMDGEAVCHRIGGVLAFVYERRPPQNAQPGEMVTTFVTIEWKDRTDSELPVEAPRRVAQDPEPEELEAALEAEAEDPSMEPSAR